MEFHLKREIPGLHRLQRAMVLGEERLQRASETTMSGQLRSRWDALAVAVVGLFFLP